MSHKLSSEDVEFRDAFESCTYAAEQFNHRRHLSLAYIYLTECDTESACSKMRDSIIAFVQHNGVDPKKYHETITRAWILAVRHFMEQTSVSESSDHFIEQNPIMLDTKIMLTHYSTELLFSPGSQSRVCGTRLDPIPRYRD